MDVSPNVRLFMSMHTFPFKCDTFKYEKREQSQIIKELENVFCLVDTVITGTRRSGTPLLCDYFPACVNVHTVYCQAR